MLDQLGPLVGDDKTSHVDGAESRASDGRGLCPGEGVRAGDVLGIDEDARVRRSDTLGSVSRFTTSLLLYVCLPLLGIGEGPYCSRPKQLAKS